jgi:hypothetical protein
MKSEAEIIAYGQHLDVRAEKLGWRLELTDGNLFRLTNGCTVYTCSTLDSVSGFLSGVETRL